MPEKIEGFEIAADFSVGEVTCTGCWDKSEHDINADTTIPKGDPIYLKGGMTDCGMEWDAYCGDCAREYNVHLETECQLLSGLDTLTNRN